MALLTAGDPDRVTGGYLFHRRLADRAPAHGAQLSFVSVPELPLPWSMASGPAWLRARALRVAEVVVLDSIAAAPAAPWLGGVNALIVGMLHQPPGGIEGAPAARAVRARFDLWAYRRADSLMVASDWLAQQLVAAGVPASRLIVVPPGKDPAKAAEVSEEGLPGARAELRGGRRSAALCVANWLPRKGIIELLEAVARLPPELVTLHLVGDTSVGGRYAGRVAARIAQPDLGERVVVHGIVSAEEVGRLYRTADFFVLPSFEEPYGTVWGEAMAAGLPVIGWQAGNLPFLADHRREALLVPVGDVAALSSAVDEVVRDEALRLRLGQAAALRAESRPTWDETAARFFAVIDAARAHRRGPAPAAG